MIPRSLCLLLLILLAACSGLSCATLGELFRDPQDAVAPLITPDPLYEELVTHYIELCAVSQYRPLHRKLGGIPGHAVMYLKGACRDESSPYPRLRPCRYASSDTADPEHGAGVSVNRWLKNVNWIATPGKFLFYAGEVLAYELLDQARVGRTVGRALGHGRYRGGELHPIGDAPAPPEIRAFVAGHSIGTDFDRRFGRTVHCLRLPVTPDMLARAMEFLNGLNDEYWNGEADYEWSGYADNCVHTLHNALAAAGVWKSKSIRTTKLRQLFNLAVPANSFVDLAFLSNEYPIDDFGKIRRDELRWRGLTEDDWLPAVPGALVKTLPVLQVNALYDTKFRMFVLGGFFGNDTLKRAQKLLSDGRYLQIDANLRYFYDRYQAILAERDPDGEWTDALRGEEHRRDREIYYAYIEHARDAVLSTLKRLAELDILRKQLIREAYKEWRIRVRQKSGSRP